MKDKAFTLIELLVVIAVIGLLSSIVIVNLTGTRGKANIARGLQFSQSVHNALGSEAVGVWNFDEGSGMTANDSSGYGNNGTLYNFISPHGWTTDNPSNSGYSLSLDGSNDYVRVPHSDFLSSEIFGTSEIFTLAAWAYPKAWADWAAVINKATGGSWSNTTSGMWASNDAGFRCVMGSNVSGNPSGSSIGISYKPPLDTWYHIVCTADGTYLTMYVNGNYRGRTAISNLTYPRSENSAPLVFGRRCESCSPSFNGLIDEVRIYEKALETAQVEELYYAGLDSLLAEGLIDQEEYQEKLSLR
jgi:prepilin-type N-terminal cleavage/methylation domain-containing protein